MANLLSKTLQSRWTFVAIVVLGLALRLVVWAVAGESLGGGAAEANGKVAVRFAGGEMFDDRWHPYHPPGLSLYLAVFYRLFGADDVVTTAAMLALYVVLCLVVYGLASMVMDRLAANLAALVVAITPSLVVLSLSTQASLLVAAALVGGAALTLRASGRGAPLVAGCAGVLLGVAVLAEPYAILAALVWPAVVLLRRRQPLSAAVALVGVLVVVGGWSMNIHHRSQHWVFVNHGLGKRVFLGNNEWTPLYRTWWLTSDRTGMSGFDDFEAVADEYETHALPEQMNLFGDHGFRHMADRPDLLAVRILARVRGFFGFHTLAGAIAADKASGPTGMALIGLEAAGWSLVAMAAAALFFLPPMRNGGYDAARWLGALVVLFAAPYWLFLAHANDHLAVLPVIGILGAVAVSRWAEGPRRISAEALAGRRRKLLAVVVMIVFVAIQAEWAWMNMAH